MFNRFHWWYLFHQPSESLHEHTNSFRHASPIFRVPKSQKNQTFSRIFPGIFRILSGNKSSPLDANNNRIFSTRRVLLRMLHPAHLLQQMVSPHGTPRNRGGGTPGRKFHRGSPKKLHVRRENTKTPPHNNRLVNPPENKYTPGNRRKI